MAVKGVDISEHNGDVDFSKLKAAGVEFAILRCGYGSDYPGQQDVEFENNVRRAEAAGMPYGVYHYAYARNAAGGRAEAAHALRLLGNRKPVYGVWYDMEDAATLGGDLAGAAESFCSAVEQAGLYAGVYASLNWWENYLTSPVFDKYDRWCAQYNSECELRKPYGIWQCSDAWKIDGKKFDGNWAYKDYPALTGTKKEEDMTEAQARKIAREEIASYINGLGTKETPEWAREAMDYAVRLQVFQGGTEGGLRPESFLKRDELAQVLFNRDTQYKTIDDVPEWAKPTIGQMLKEGIITGYGTDKNGRTILNMSGSDLRSAVWCGRKTGTGGAEGPEGTEDKGEGHA